MSSGFFWAYTSKKNPDESITETIIKDIYLLVSSAHQNIQDIPE